MKGYFIFIVFALWVLLLGIVGKSTNTTFTYALERCSRDYIDIDLRNCVFDYLDGLRQISISDFLSTLDRYNIPENSLGVYCHEIAAEIGKRGVYIHGQTAIDSCNDMCAAGCFQGALEGMYENGIVSEESLQTMCDELKDSEHRMACIHGYGHVEARLHEIDTMQAWAACSGLPEKDQPECGNAVFMQLYGSSPAEIVVRPPADLVGWCGTFPEVYKGFCYERVGNLAYHKESDLDIAARACWRVPKSSQSSCYTLLGKSYVLGFEQGPERQSKVELYCQRYGVGTIDNCVDVITH